MKISDDTLKGLSRWSAWILLLLIVVMFLSGYGILHFRIFSFLWSKATAFKVHTTLQSAIAFFFLLHVLLNLRAMLGRKGVRGLPIDSALLLTGVGLFAAALYLTLLG